MQSRPRGRAAFTLVELLVVISIIALLAGIALPAMNTALEKAKTTRCSSMINQLHTAIIAYSTEYGAWPAKRPDDPTEDVDVQELYKVLTASEGDTPEFNTRKISFIEFTNEELDNPRTPTMVVDPWYKTSKDKAHQIYHIRVDSDFDNQIWVPNVSGLGGAAEKKGIANKGPDPFANAATFHTGSDAGGGGNPNPDDGIPQVQVNGSVVLWDPGMPIKGKVNKDPARFVRSW